MSEKSIDTLSSCLKLISSTRLVDIFFEEN